MNKNTKRYIICGSIMMSIAIVLGAFGAHGLKNILNEYELSIYKTATEYHIYHSIGLIIISIISIYIENKYIHYSKILMIAGVIVFSGSLYALALSGYKILGAVTPIGGLLLILSWLMVALGAIKGNKENS